MGMVPLKCPGCGANIELDDSREFGFCNFCGTKVMQDKVIVEHSGSVRIDVSDESFNMSKRINECINDKLFDKAFELADTLSIREPDNEYVKFVSYEGEMIKMKTSSNSDYAVQFKNITNKLDKLFEYVKDNYLKDEQQDEIISCITHLVNYHEKTAVQNCYSIQKAKNEESLKAINSSTNSQIGRIALMKQLPVLSKENAYKSYMNVYKNELGHEFFEMFYTKANKIFKRRIVLTPENMSLANAVVSILVEDNKDNSLHYRKKAVEWIKEYGPYDKVEEEFLRTCENPTNTSVNANNSAENKGGCYVATAVYGSYDCPQVWTLRRYRDNQLASTWYGRAFIHTYYAISPTIVKWFGDTQWFKHMWKGKLDRMVNRLNGEGVENTPYNDIEW